MLFLIIKHACAGMTVGGKNGVFSYQAMIFFFFVKKKHRKMRVSSSLFLRSLPVRRFASQSGAEHTHVEGDFNVPG